MESRESETKRIACERHCAALEAEITEVRGMLALSRDEVVKHRRDLDRKDHEVAALRQRAEELERDKYGTPCKCEQWIKACGEAEERAEAAEAEVERLRSGLAAWRHSLSLPDCHACSVLDAHPGSALAPEVKP